MLCRLELNPALAKINPLFYKQVRVRVSPETVDSFTVKYDSVGYIDNINGSVLKSVEHWKVRDSLDADGNQVYDLIGNLRVPIRTPVIIDTLYDVSSIQYTQLPGEGDNAGESF